MPLSSSYHDYGGMLHAGTRQRSAPSSYATAAGAPTRSLVPSTDRDRISLHHRLSAVAHGQQKTSPNSTGGAVTVVLGTASLASHRESDVSRPLPMPLPQPVPERRTASGSPRLHDNQQRQCTAPSIGGRSSSATNRQSRRATQPMPSHSNTAFQAAVSGRARTSGLYRTALSASVTRDTVAVYSTTVNSTSSVASPSPLSSFTAARVAALRPFFTSREADYLNVAYQRGLMGRFRCAVPVVMRTPAAATSHHYDMVKSEELHLATATADVAERPKGGTNEHDESHAKISQAPVRADGANTASANHVEVPDATGTTSAGGGIAEQLIPTETLPTAAAHSGNATLPHTRPSLSRSAASVVSGSTVHLGRGSGRRLFSSSASVTASPLSCRSVRSTPMPTSLRKNSLGGLPISGPASGMPAASMELLIKSGLHTSLWVAQQDGGIEVRSMTNPSQVLSRVPRSDPRMIITTLAEVCGNRVVAGFTDGSLHVFDAFTLKEVGEHRPHTAAVTKLLYAHSAPSALALAGADGHAAGGNAKSGGAPTSSLLLTGSLDRTITVWAAATMTLLHRLKGNVGGVRALATTTVGGFAFSGSDDGTIRMWDVVHGQQWEMTKDERAQLACRSRKEASAGDECDDGVVDDSDEDNSADLPAHSRGRFAFPPLTTPRTNGDGPTQSLQLRPPPAAARSHCNGGSSGTSVHPDALGSDTVDRHCSHSFGGVTAVPRVTGTLSRGTLRLHQRHLRAQARDTAGSSRSLPLMEDALSPTGTATPPSPFREEDGTLAGLGRGISPLRNDLDDEVEKTGMDAAPAVHIGPPAGCSRAPTSARKRRSTTKKARAADKGQVSATTAATGAAGKKRHKGKTPSGKVKHKKVQTARKRSVTTTSSTAAVASASRCPTSTLELRLDMWIRLYKQRVFLSAAPRRLSLRLTAGGDKVKGMNWPIECAHVEYITALTVVEDRLLVSASYDATAKVFALPSGQYVRTLTSSRRMPLSSVQYDSGVGRIYTGFSDGAVAVYDLTNAELPLLSQLQSSQTILSCTFASLAMAPMQRFVVHARFVVGTHATEEEVTHPDTAVLTTIAQFDKTTKAHAPNQTTSSYRVGQPSLRELNAAMSLQSLQQRRVAHRTVLAQRSAKGTLEEVKLRDERQCGVVLAQAHYRRHTERFFWRWQRLTQRRATLRQLYCLAEARAHTMAQDLLGQYLQHWMNATRQRKKAAAGVVLRAVQLTGSDAATLSVRAEVRSGQRRRLDRIAMTMANVLSQLTLRRAYRRWREFQRVRHAELKQSVGFNKLVLSMNASADAPACYTLIYLTRVATRRANHTNALWLLTELTERWQSHRQRWHFFTRWRAFAKQRQRMQVRQEEDAGWRLVEPLSSMLVQPQLLRRRCFEAWRTFALYFARSGQLTSERETLQREWATLQRTLDSPTAVAELKTKVSEAETKITQTVRERVVLAERVQILADEDSTRRTEEALRVLIAGYFVPDAVTAVAPTAATTPSAHVNAAHTTLDVRRPSLASSVESGATGGANRSRLKSLSSGTASSGYAEDGLVLSREEQQEKRLLIEVSAVLRALKGSCIQCARDDKLLAEAHALSLRLPIYEPLPNDFSASAVSTPSRRSGQQQQQTRSLRSATTWSVSSAKNGASTSVLAHTSTASPTFLSSFQPPLPSQRRRYSTLPGSGASGDSDAHVTDASTPRAATANSNTTPRTSAAAQMWAAQSAEENYGSLADAFNSIYANLLALLCTAAQECGVTASAASRSAPALPLISEGRRTTQNGTGEEGENGQWQWQPPAVAPSWLAQVPLKQRRIMVGEVLKLTTLFDSFAAHSDLPVERTGSFSIRGSAKTRAMPLCSLCSHETALSLLRHAAMLLELVDPQLWPRQLKLSYLQEAYAAAIADLNATVTSSHPNDTQRRTSTVLTHSESEDRSVASLPTPQAVRQPNLCLSAEVLQRAADNLHPTPYTAVRGMRSSQQLEVQPSPTIASSGTCQQSMRPSAAPQPTTTTTSSASVPPHPMSLLSNLDSLMAGRNDGTGDKLNGMNKSAEEMGRTSTPEPQHAQSASISHRTLSAVSTPRSYTPRPTTPSAAGTSTALLKPYLGFRVNVTRDAHAAGHGATCIAIRDVAGQYINADGVEVDGPALVAGLQVGDQLIRFAGYAVTDLAAFNAVVSRHVHSGAELPVVVQRGEELLSTTIVVGTRVA